MVNPPLFDSPGAVARRLGVPEKWLEAEARAGRVPCLFAGRRMLCHLAETERALLDRSRSEVTDVRDGEALDSARAKSESAGGQGPADS